MGDIVATLGDVADATWVYENWENQVLLEAGKEINYFNLGDVDPIFDFCAPAIAATHEVLTEAPRGGAKPSWPALDRGYRDGAAHPEEAVLEVKDMMPGDSSDALLIRSQKHLVPHSAGRKGPLGPHRARSAGSRMADFLVECGLISGRRDDEYTNAFFTEE